MKYVFRDNLDSRVGVVSNLHGFLNRNLDSGFKSKWSGYWAPPYKYLDYYAIRINGVWLNGENLQATEYGDEFVHHYETDTLSITEKVSFPDELPGFKLELSLTNNTDAPKAVHGSIELGVDIRSKSNDIGPENYSIEDDGVLEVSKDDRYLRISSDDVEFEYGPYTKEHYPGERQRCFVPGLLEIKKELEPHSEEKVELVFTTDRDSTKALERHEQMLEGELGRAFNDSVDSMLNLIYNRNELGVIAGHPWFQSYWARDSFWTFLGLIDAGYFEETQEMLENFAENNLTGQIALSEQETDEFPRDDTLPLFIIAVDKLSRHYGLSKTLEKAQKDAMNRLALNQDNLVENDPMGTWMDTLERPVANDVQALWLEAAKIMGGERTAELEEGLKEFQNEEFMIDHLGGDAPRAINCAVPLMFGQIEDGRASNYIERINGEFSSRFGARTRSMADPGYEASGYHSGSVWGLTTGWAAAANLRYGYYKQGANFLEKIANFIDVDQPGALPEVVDAETGENLGCPEQAWSAGMMVHVIDTYLLGVNVAEDYVEINPAPGINYVRRGKRVRGETIDFKVENGEVELLNNPELEVRL